MYSEENRNTPYYPLTLVSKNDDANFFQECERMNLLSNEIRRSLKELDLGLKGELTITNDMENLGNCLFFDQVPPSWTKRAYASLHGLANWYVK